MSTDGFSLATESVFIYYSHDGVLWRIAPATAAERAVDAVAGDQPSVEVDTRVAPLGAGFRPSASESGMLVYHDFDNNVIIRDIVTGKSMSFLTIVISLKMSRFRQMGSTLRMHIPRQQDVNVSSSNIYEAKKFSEYLQQHAK